MKGIFSVLVENKAGVLSKTAGLFARRGFNIDSLAVGETDDRDISSMTIISTGDERIMEQIEKQLNKKLDVIKVKTFEESESVSRELLMMRLKYNSTNRRDIVENCAMIGAQIVDMSTTSFLIQLCDTPERADLFIRMMTPFGINELARTGITGLKRGSDDVIMFD